MSGDTGVPADFSLRLRLDALKKSFEQIQAVDEAVSERRDEASLLHDSVRGGGGLETKLKIIKRELETALGHLKDVQEAVEEDEVPDLELLEKALEELRQADDHTKKMIGRVTSISTVVKQTEATWVEIPRAGLDDVNAALNSKCAQRIKKVEDLEQVLINEPTEAATATAWRDYEDLAFHDGERLFNGERLFAEYVDFLGGLALRTTRIDDGVCTMADEVLRTCHSILGRHSMTLPSRRVPAQSTLARIVRLPFPEWTIWAVPVGAHEMGHLLLSGHERIASDALRRACPAIEVFLADTFATCFMGPSYAYASILVTLDPYCGPTQVDGSSDGQSLDGERASVILATLKRMDHGVYEGVCELLGSYWKKALAAFDIDPEAAGNGASPLSEAVSAAWDFLEEEAPRLCYKTSNWQEITQWPSLLKSEARNFDDVTVSSSNDVRDVINAAWHQRVLLGDGTGWQAKDLADAAIRLWRTRFMDVSRTGKFSRRRG